MEVKKYNELTSEQKKEALEAVADYFRVRIDLVNEDYFYEKFPNTTFLVGYDYASGEELQVNPESTFLY